MRATGGSAAIQSRLLILWIASLLAAQAPRNDELIQQAKSLAGTAIKPPPHEISAAQNFPLKNTP
ncbi:MAG: hypothetical protein LBK53_03915 [Heliobacteriaceae bacterium]|nr:hypothetical protein [Heliobacteriaceae bacterium]